LTSWFYNIAFGFKTKEEFSMKRIFVLVVVGVFFAFLTLAIAADKVIEGSTVSLHYTLTVDGKVVDSSKGKPPFEFKVGGHQVIPGFEKAVMGMKVGGKKKFKVSPEEGYGKVDPALLKEVPKKNLPKDLKPEVGMMLSARQPNGQSIPVKITEVKKDTVVVDFNHPLAGKTLNFDIEVVGIK